VKRTGGMYPLVRVDSTRCKAGGVLLTTTVGLAGIDRLLSTALSRWRKPSAVHDPGKIITDLAVSLALGGTAWPTSPCCVRSRVCMGRLRETRRCPRLIGVVAADVAAVVKAINTARAAARARVWGRTHDATRRRRCQRRPKTDPPLPGGFEAGFTRQRQQRRPRPPPPARATWHSQATCLSPALTCPVQSRGRPLVGADFTGATRSPARSSPR